MHTSFTTKWDYIDLIPILANTPLSKELDSHSDYLNFGKSQVRLYGIDATVVFVGPLSTDVKAYPKPSGIRALLLRLGLVRNPLYGKSFMIGPENYLVESHSQELGLRLASGHEASFILQHVGRGLPVKIDDYLTAIFATTGADLVPFALKRGVDWTWLYGDMSARLESAGVCYEAWADERFNAVAGVIHVSMR